MTDSASPASGTGPAPQGAEPQASQAKPLVPDALRVVDYVNHAVPSEVFAEYLARYNDDGWANDETWGKFKALLNNRVLVNTTMRAILTEVHERWSEHPGCGEDEKHIDVSGENEEAGTHWGLDFTPWSEWKGMLVEDRTGLNLTISQVAAHLFYEMAWHGWEEDGVEKLAEIEDRVEAIERGLAGVSEIARPAQGIEAQSAKTAGLGPQDESPVT